MTHAEALRDDRLGLAGRACPGELARTARFENPGDGGASPVTVYRCPDCGHALSIEDGGFVRNCYPVAALALVRDLADRLDARPHLARPAE
jgi:hypothetical protein